MEYLTNLSIACLVFPRGKPHGEIADEFGMFTAVVSLAVHGLRKRYGELLRREVALTVDSEAEVEQELRFLMSELAG